MRWVLILLLSWVYSGAFAQSDKQVEFTAFAEKMGVDVYWPTEDSYRERPVQQNDYLPYQFALYSRREKMEIRYYLQPSNEADPTSQLPHVALGRLLMHLASNDDDTPVAVHEVTPDVLTQEYAADWGTYSFFPPKQSFAAGFAHCQLVSIFREGVGMAYVLFLFNDAPATLENRRLALRFADLPQDKP